jgi:drug/metabolite transporter (DMT)-like permease
MREVVLIIFCVLLYGGATFFKRLGLLNLHPYQFLIIVGFCYFLFTPVWYLLINSEVNKSQVIYSKEGIFFAIIYALASMAAGLILAFLLRTTNSPGTLIVMVNLSSLITLFLSYFFLHEELSPIKIFAIILALLSLVLMNY